MESRVLLSLDGERGEIHWRRAEINDFRGCRERPAKERACIGEIFFYSFLKKLIFHSFFEKMNKISCFFRQRYAKEFQNVM
jgi:hypothetical protein